jgi:tetratricopeptide (TPR) repeat protein
MYLRGNKWNMTSRPKRRPSMWRIGLLVVLIGIALYVNQVVVPHTDPLFVPTATPTQSPESYVNKAEEFFKEGKLPQAVDAYNEAINSDPSNAANYVALARMQVITGLYDEAVVNAQNALLKNPNNPLAHAVQGWALGFLGKYGEAEREIKVALDLDPNSALAHAYFAEILINQGDATRLDKAAEESRKALELDSSLLETHRVRGIVLYNTQNLDQAVEQFQAALAINKNIADVHLYLGVTYKALEQYDLAEESLLAAYALNPKDTVGLTELARVYFADGRFPQAAQYAEEAVRVEPGDPRLHGNLGIMYYKGTDYEKAIPELVLAVHGGSTQDGVAVEGLPLSYDPRIMEYYWYYGFALARSNRCGEAVPIFRALLTGVPDNEIAVYNANEGLNVCEQGVATPAVQTTQEVTPTPN